MGKNQNSVVMLQIWVKFWWMIPMDVKYNQTKFEQEKHSGGGRERDSQVADLSFKNCSVGQKTTIFGPKKPWNTFKTAKRREEVGTLHVRLDFPVSKSSLRPSDSMICPEKAQKGPQKLQMPTVTNQE